MKTSNLRGNLVILVLFLLLVTLFTWPFVAHLNNGVAGGYIDTLLNSWIISWDSHAILHSPLSLFQANINYPSVSSLAFSEHLFTLGVLSLPLHLAGANPVLVHNLLLFLGLVFSAFTAFLLIEYLTRNRYAAFAGGAFFALCPYHLSKMAHLHISFMPFLPLVLLYLFKYMDEGRKRHLVFFGLALLAQCLTSWYLMAFTLLAVAAILAGYLLFRWGRQMWSRLLPAVGVMAVAGLIILPFALPYFQNRQSYPEFARSLTEIDQYSATPASYLNVPPENVVYGSLGAPFKQTEIGIGFDAESTLFPGFLITLLALIGLVPWWVKRKRRTRQEEEDLPEPEPPPEDPVFGRDAWLTRVLPFAALGIGGFILSLGPYIGGHRNFLFLALYHSGIFSFVRMPARYGILLILALAVLGSLGLARLFAAVKRRGWGRGSGAPLLGIGLIAVLLVELLTFNLPISPVPVGGGISPVYATLTGGNPDAGAVIDAPVSGLAGAALYEGMFDLTAVSPKDYIDHENFSVYYSTLNWRKLVNGFSGYYPPTYRRVMMEMQAFPSARSISVLRTSGVAYVAWHWDWLPAEQQASARVQLASFPELEIASEGGGVTLFRIRGTDAGAAMPDLEWTAAAPATAAPGATIRLGAVLANPGATAFATGVEQAQPVTATWRDAASGIAARNKGEYFLPPYIEGGSLDKVSFLSTTPATPGDYTLELSFGGAASADLAPVPVHLAADALPPETKADAQILGVSLAGSTPASASGLFDVTLVFRNTGPVTLQSLDGAPPGTIDLGFTWYSNGQEVWEGQRATLPCDVAPGQQLSAGALLRAPLEPGVYTVRCQLVKEGTYWLGTPVDLSVTVR